MYGTPNREPLYIDPINYDNFMARVFAGNFTMPGMLMHHIALVEQELEALFRHRYIFLKYHDRQDPWKIKLVYLQNNLGAVFRFPDSEKVIDSGETLDDFIVHMSKKLMGVRHPKKHSISYGYPLDIGWISGYPLDIHRISSASWDAAMHLSTELNIVNKTKTFHSALCDLEHCIMLDFKNAWGE
jgi:hypothetical protein